MARDVVMVNGLPASGKSTLGPVLAEALGAGFLSKDRVKEALASTVDVSVPGLGAIAMNTVYALAGALDGVVVIDSWWFRPRDLSYAAAALSSATVEVWCDVPASLARSRYVTRRRPALYEDAERLASSWDRWAAEASPLGIGPVIRVDTSGPVDVPALAVAVERALS